MVSRKWKYLRIHNDRVLGVVSFGHNSGLKPQILCSFYCMRGIFSSNVNNGWIQHWMNIYIYLDICVLTETCKFFLTSFFIVCAFQSSKSHKFQCQKHGNAVISWTLGLKDKHFSWILIYYFSSVIKGMISADIQIFCGLQVWIWWIYI